MWGGHGSKSRLQAPGVRRSCNVKCSLLAACPRQVADRSGAIQASRGRGAKESVRSWNTLVAPPPPDSRGDCRPPCLPGTWAGLNPVWGFTAFDPQVPPDGSYFCHCCAVIKEHKLGVQTSSFHFDDLLGYFAQSFSGAVTF